jgi:hypothetical protein
VTIVRALFSRFTPTTRGERVVTFLTVLLALAQAATGLTAIGLGIATRPPCDAPLIVFVAVHVFRACAAASLTLILPTGNAHSESFEQDGSWLRWIRSALVSSVQRNLMKRVAGLSSC